ncbi:hypothetical protein QBC46DRAFT_445709 [Diplogelasinospora grovesii]|uniref:Fucose-specific lectin n=1 Tax=Diplogelasinospora grovesii TaxID=303347 RepID=A0AAN6S9J9_9PEZI|nr:hypothetical protein QBC46DRAFT_445709 [Diplogelasinospora grovesii]
MSGAAVYLNPTAPAGKQLHLFYNTNKKNLALQLRDETKTADETETFQASQDDQDGIVVNPAQVTTTDLTGVDIVVGFTAKAAPASLSGDCKCEPTQNDVSIISPIYQPLAATEVGNVTIASTSSPQTAWILYLTGTDPNTTVINERSLGEDSPGSYDNTVKILPGTSLAVYYVPDGGSGNDGNRYVIYQANDPHRLHEYSPNTEDVWDKELVNSGDAKSQTPLAVTYVDSKTYLYYVDTSDQIRVIVKSNDKWGSSSAVASAHSRIDPSSQLTVVPAKNGNHLFYLAKGDAPKYKFQHIVHYRT